MFRARHAAGVRAAAAVQKSVGRRMAENRADQIDGVGFVEMFFERFLVWALPIVKIEIVAAERPGLHWRRDECRGRLLDRFIINALTPLAKDRLRDVFGGIENAINGTIEQIVAD